MSFDEHFIYTVCDIILFRSVNIILPALFNRMELDVA